MINDNKECDNYAILDHALFQTECASYEEAHFLLAVLNSGEMATRAKPFCTTNWAKKIRNFRSSVGSCSSRATNPATLYTSA